MDRKIFLSLDDLMEFKWVFGNRDYERLHELQGKQVNIFAPRIVGEQSLTAFWEDIAPKLEERLGVKILEVVTRKDIHEVLKKLLNKPTERAQNPDSMKPATLFQNYIRALPKADGTYSLYADSDLEYSGLYIKGDNVAIVKIISVC